MHQNQNQTKRKETLPVHYRTGQWWGRGSVVELAYTDQHAGVHPQYGKYEQSEHKTCLYGEVRFMLYKMNLRARIF